MMYDGHGTIVSKKQYDCSGLDGPAFPERGHEMKIAVVKDGILRRALWGGDDLTADWDVDRRELVIRGHMDGEKCDEVLSCALEKCRLRVEIEDIGATRLRWHGRVLRAEVLPDHRGRPECMLTIALDG